MIVSFLGQVGRCFRVATSLGVILIVVVSGTFYSADASEEFPIGIMSVSGKALPAVAEGGFDLVHSYTFEKSGTGYFAKKNNNDAVRSYLDDCLRLGIRAMIGFSRHAVKNSDLEYIKQRVMSAMNHKALYGWYLYDEPEGRGNHHVSADQLQKAYEAIKSVDPNHPVILTSYSIFNKNNPYLSTFDILATDQYPVPDRRPDQILSRIDPASRLTHAIGKSNWAIIQAHNLGLYRLKKKKSIAARYPSRPEMRFMSYLAVMHGVKGLLYYCYSDGKTRLANEEAQPHWRKLTSLVRELQEMAPVFAESSESGVVELSGTKVEVWVRDHAGSLCMITANRSRRTASATINLGVAVRNQITPVLFEKRAVSIEDDRLVDIWAPWDVHVYKIAKETGLVSP